MKQHDNLFELIGALAPAEKRYIRLAASPQQRKHTNYMRLFDAIDSNRGIDDDGLRRLFAGEPFTRQLHVTKRYLHTLIMKSLRAYHTSGTIAAQLREALHDAEILVAKQLLRQARQALRRAAVLAEEHELDEYGLAIVLGEQDGRLQGMMGYNSAECSTAGRRAELLERLREYYNIDTIATRVGQIMTGRGLPRTEEQREELERLANAPILNDEENLRSQRGRRHYYYIKSSYHFARREYEQAAGYVRKKITLYNQHTPLRVEHITDYIGAHTNLAILLEKIGNYQEFYDTLATMRAIPYRPEIRGEQRSNLAYRAFNFTNGLELLHWLRLGEFHRAAAIAARVEQERGNFAAYLKEDDNLRLDFLIASAQFGLGEYKNALATLTRIMQTGPTELRLYIYNTARLLNLIIHYELGNMDYLEHQIRATYRYLRSRGYYHAFEREILTFFRNIAKGGTSPDMLVEHFRTLHSALLHLEQSPNEQPPLLYFDFIAWLESAISNIPFQQAVAARGRR